MSITTHRTGVELILNEIRYKDWELHVGQDESRLFLQVQFQGRCTVTGAEETQYGRKWLLSPHMTRSEVVTTAFKAILTAEEHECREHFMYRGKAIFGPHLNVDKLVELCGYKGAHDYRR